MRRVVVTGMGLVSCFGSDIEKFYQKILSGQSGICSVDEFKEMKLSTTFAAFAKDHCPEDYFPPKDARRFDKAITYTMASSVDACTMANLDFNSFDPNRMGCIVSSGMGGMKRYIEGVQTLYKENKGPRKVSPFFVPNIITNMGGGLVAIRFGFLGPNYSISTACATANYSIKAAADYIRSGEADIMLGGGVEAPENAMCAAGFSAMKALSRDKDGVDPKSQSKPWDKNRDGFVLGSGAGTLVLEELEHAKKRGATILGEYLGGSINCDAYHMTSPCEDGAGAARCMIAAIKNAGVSPEDIDYVSAHGTSTPTGDMCEVKAIQRVFGEDTSIKMNSIKSMIGHALGAAGGIEAIATLMAFRTGKLYPTTNIVELEEGLRNIDIIRDEAQEFKGNIAISNSFGFGGHNSTLVFKKYED